MRSESEPDEGTPVLGRPSVATEVEEAAKQAWLAKTAPDDPTWKATAATDAALNAVPRAPLPFPLPFFPFPSPPRSQRRRYSARLRRHQARADAQRRGQTSLPAALVSSPPSALKLDE